MKSLITAVALTAISFSAQASVSEKDLALAIESGNSAVCNTLDGKHGVYNKSSLTDFDKCWLDVHRADKSAGVIDGIAWAKIAGKYYDVPVKVLVQSGSKTAAIDMFKETIAEEIQADVIAEVVDVATQTVNAAESEIKTIIETVDITDTAEFIEAQNTIKALNADIDTLNTQISDLETAAERMTANFNTNFGRILSQVQSLNAQLAQPFVNFDANLNRDFAERVANGDNTGSQLFHVADGGSRINTDGSVSIALISSAYTMADGIIVDRSAYLNANGMSLSEVVSSLATQIDNALQSAYNDGYADGYADGYRDGFRDGVDSVR